MSIAIFSFLSFSIYGLYLSILKGIVSYRERTAVSALANQYIEIARNLPYSKIGTQSGNPHGELPDISNPVESELNGISYQVYYVINYIDDPADGTIVAGTDFAPNDYKQIKLYVKNSPTGSASSFFTSISPKGLENLDSGGAVSISIFDAVGQPVPEAVIQIKNNSINPAINLTRLSDSSGNWIEVGLPDSVNGYSITVAKNGYSSDMTHPITPQNLNPIKPDATVSDGQVTQVSFSIDKLSDLTFIVLNQSCQPVPNVDLRARGSKLIGTPSVFKFDNEYVSSSNGRIVLDNIEWDNYSPIANDSEYMIYGSSPIQQVSLSPDTSQDFTLIVGAKTENSLLVIVKDASTGNPIEGATIELQKNSGPVSVKFTGGSALSQQDWSGGSGQADYFDTTRYFEDDGNISNNGVPLGLRLSMAGQYYVPSGSLVSSTFDTGTDETSYTILTWQPASQNPNASIKFQLAANNDNETWNYTGPDGTSNSFYDVSGTTINSLNGNRYFRYKAYLSTQDSLSTPVLTNVNINYVSGCRSPGQSFFAGLEGGEGYKISISMPDYQGQIVENATINGYQVLQIPLSR